MAPVRAGAQGEAEISERPKALPGPDGATSEVPGPVTLQGSSPNTGPGRLGRMAPTRAVPRVESTGTGPPFWPGSPISRAGCSRLTCRAHGTWAGAGRDESFVTE